MQKWTAGDGSNLVPLSVEQFLEALNEFGVGQVAEASNADGDRISLAIAGIADASDESDEGEGQQEEE